MINLLPPDIKQGYVYARRNTKLLNWCFAMFFGIIGLAVVIFFGQLYLDNSVKSYAAQAETTRQQLQLQKLDETQKRVSEISSSLQLVVQVLSREVLFSKLIGQIGSAIPSGTALSDLRISKLEGGIDLQFIASDYQTATQVQLNLQDPNNKIFDKADILSINCNSTTTADPRYPCQVNIRAQFAKNNPFLFINGQATSGVKP